MSWTSEKHRRLIASMPCANCGVEGYSQAAHTNEGKGGGIKTSDATCIPLCCTRPDIPGCHHEYDRGTMWSRDEKRELARGWLIKTLTTLVEDERLKAK
jgi:hypothetical protein